jgi:CDP-paratose 2-epimerase
MTHKTVVVVTGSAGLVGSQSAIHFARRGHQVIGIDNDLRSYFFGPSASTLWNRQELHATLGDKYTHVDLDIRDARGVERLFEDFKNDIGFVIHCAAQPSHDWAAREPHTDFGVNAVGTLNLLEAARINCPEVPFIFLSTNKVYGDTVNRLPMVELETRWELDESHPWAKRGIPEEMSIDQTLHSLFGASKVAGDTLVQEYGRYFGMPTVCFRAGCITGPAHSGAVLHGFLAYLVKCVTMGTEYEIYGYGGKQVRDNIHSEDLVAAFAAYLASPRSGETYNIGGGRASNCSLIEAVEIAESIVGKPLHSRYIDNARRGDHIWWISDYGKFQSHYPAWNITKGIRRTIEDIADSLTQRNSGE